MARPKGSMLTETKVTIHIKESDIVTLRKKRYVFIAVISPKVRALARAKNDLSMYMRFMQSVSRSDFDVVEMWGLRAINIDKPSAGNVSIALDIRIGEGIDEAKRTK